MFQHPESPASSLSHAPHEGQLFQQRLAGLSAGAHERQAPSAAESEQMDLDQRVRNVGEW